MPIEVTMPRLSDTMESGTVLKWNVQEGDTVASGDVVADVETDKATMELTVFDDGRLAKIIVPEGQTVEVGAVIAVLAEDGEDVAEVAAGASRASVAGGVAGGMTGSEAANGSAPADAGEPAAAPAPPSGAPGAVEAAPVDGARLRISPVARRLADEHGIDVRTITGTGPSGRVVKRDVLRAVEAAAETTAARAPSARPSSVALESTAGPRGEVQQIVPATAVPMTTPASPLAEAAGESGLRAGRVALSAMRQTIARRLVESTTTIPHYQVSATIDMDPLLDLRRTLNGQLAAAGVKLSVNDFLVRGCGLAMYRHPEFNASWDGDAIVIHGEVNIGVAISMGPERGGGLVVGVIRHADRLNLRAISAETKRLAEKARTRGLSVDEMAGSTFTVSNLGMFGVDHFTAIINPPNSAILAVGAAIERPVVRDGALTVGHEMTATLSNDHRIIDGAMAARYLQTLREYLESPGMLLA